MYGYVGKSPSNAVDPWGGIPLDTIWDAANVIYDLITGDHEALAIDAASMVVPYIPAGGSKACKGVEEIGECLAREAPMRVAPGVRYLEGFIKNDLGRIEPWTAHCDDFGCLIGRTDFNANNLAQGIPDTRHHTYEWLSPGAADTGHEVLGHIEGVLRS